MRYFALLTRGLESIACTDLAEALPGAHLDAPAYRRVTITDAGPPARLLALRSVDDVFVYAGELHGLVPQRAGLAQIRAWLATLDWPAVAAGCAAVRTLNAPPRIAASASFVGARKYSAPELKAVLLTFFHETYGWHPTDDDASADLSVRVFCEGTYALAGLRLAAQPLHRRAYKQASLPGSLKPSVAWNLVRLAHTEPATRFLDPLCGAGTLVLEAAARGAQAYGGDHARAALDAARTNAAHARVPCAWTHWDATRLPLPAHSIHALASNLPFGRQVARPAALYAALAAEFARILAPAAHLALLTPWGDELAAALQAHGLHITTRFEISLYGQTPEVICARA